MKKDPTLDITAINASIFERITIINIRSKARFDVTFYLQFDLVFSALDNVEAREHLNSMCIKTNRILIDAGTTGFGG